MRQHKILDEGLADCWQSITVVCLRDKEHE